LCKTLLPLKLLVDADDGHFLAKRNLYFIFSAPCPKNVPAPLLHPQSKFYFVDILIFENRIKYILSEKF